MSSRCNANINPDKHPIKKSIVNKRTTLISLCELHITINATSIMYMEMPMDDSKFSAMKTSEKVPSERTSARMIPTAKKHMITSQ